LPYPRPTLTQLIGQAASDIASNLPGADGLLRFSNLGVLGRALAGLINGLWGYVDWIAAQATPFRATGEYLEAWAALKGVVREPATAAQFAAAFTGVNGTVLPAGTPAVRGDGAAFTTNADGTVSGGAVTVTLTAALAGAAGNTQTGQAVTLGSAIGGIASGGVAGASVVIGADTETDASLRTRMLQAYAAPPQGGDLADYVTWALEVAGVTRAWNAGVALGAGTVQVFVMLDVVEAAFGGFPQGTDGVAAAETRDTAATGDQLAVANHLYPLRPVTALVYVYAPAANTVTFTLSETSGWSAATETAVKAAIDQVLLEQAAPGGVTDAQGNAIGIVDLSYLEAAIGQVAGTAGFVITAMACTHGTLTPAGVGNIASDAGYLAVRGAVTFA
jgi:uncharacterized phage protein gp47/JayE